VNKAKPVLILLQYLQPGGLEWMVVHLAQGLNDRGQWHPIIAVYDHIEDIDQLDSILKERGIELIRLQKTKGFDLRLLLDLYRLVKKRQIHVIHTHHLGALMYASFVKLMTFWQVRILQTQHSFIHFDKFPRYVRFERWFTKFADHVSAVSGQIVAEYKRFGISAKKISLIPNGSRFAAKPSPNPEEQRELRKKLLPLEQDFSAKWILYLGRIHRGKGQDHALEIWNQLAAKSRENSRLIFIGPITDADFFSDLQKQITRVATPENVIFAGSTADATSWYQAADLFLSASESEGWPLAPLEALGSGLTCLLSDIQGHQIFFPDAEAFSLDDLAGASLVIERALTLVTNAAFRERNWLLAQTLRETYSIEAMVESYSRLYERL
jgi:glycosyltransferase involved in cell wall biosynthesis